MWVCGNVNENCMGLGQSRDRYVRGGVVDLVDGEGGGRRRGRKQKDNEWEKRMERNEMASSGEGTRCNEVEQKMNDWEQRKLEKRFNLNVST